MFKNSFTTIDSFDILKPNQTSIRARIIALGIIYPVFVAIFAFYLDLYYSPGAIEYSLRYASIPLLLIGLGFAAVPALWMPTTLDKPHALLYWAIYLLAYIPGVVVTPLKSGAQSLAFVATLLFCMLLLNLPSHVPDYSLPEFQLSESVFWRGLAILTVVMFAFVSVTLNLSLSNFTHIGIYSVREVYSAQLDTLSPIVRRFTVYFVDWIYLAISPIFFVAGGIQRSWWKVLFGILGFAVVFLITGFKTALFVPILIVVLAAFYTIGWDHFAEFALASMSVFLATTAILERLTGFITPASFVRRLVLLPGFLTSMYYDFFSTHPVTYFSDRFFARPFINYPYDLPVANVIGEAYFGRAEMSANANFWAEGFATLGYAGPILFTLFVVAAFIFYDLATKEINARARSLFTVGYLIIISNSDSISLFATNGFAVFLVVVYIYSNAKQNTDYTS